MARAKATSLLDDVLAKVVRSRPGFKPWFERLPAEQQAELRAAHAAFDPSVHQRNAYARAVIAAANERGIPICGVQGVVEWLRRPL